MKKFKKVNKNSLFHKLFIKLCRLFGYEIIDQSNFTVPTLNKQLDDSLSTLGNRSITIPMGFVNITRKVKSLSIILRTCTSVSMLTQSKKRIFEYEKSEYTLRTINSLIKSINHANEIFKNINLDFIIIDHNSDIKTIDKMKLLLSKENFKNQIISLETESFIKQINPINENNKKVSQNQLSNMANIHQSLLLSKKCDDLIYFVEDDYIHSRDAIKEMILTYEKISSILKKELILCPTDYPYLYAKSDYSKIFL